MVFPSNVERWRQTVQAALSALFANFPTYRSLQDRFIAPIVGGGVGPVGGGSVDLILAIIQKESSGNPGAIGDGGDSLGLMQLNYGAGTPQSIGYAGTREGLLDAKVNVYWGSKYFFSQLDRYKDVDRAILAYNAGSYRTTEAGLPINLGYLTAVLSYLTEKKTPVSSWRDFSPSSGSLAGAGADAGVLVDSRVRDVDHKNELVASDQELKNVTSVTSGDRQDGPTGDTFRKVLAIGAAVLAAVLSTIVLLFSHC